MKRMHEMLLGFAVLALDRKAVLGLATPVYPTAEHTTININAGVAIDPNPWDRNWIECGCLPDSTIARALLR